MVLKPLGDRVIIEVAKEEEKTAGEIVLASAAKEKPRTGTVVAIGEGHLLENGGRVPAAMKAGNRVMFRKYAGTKVRYEGKEYLIVTGKDIVAIIE